LSGQTFGYFVQEEVEEVEQKVAEAEHSRSYARQFFTNFCTPVFLEAFVLTFLAGQRTSHTPIYHHRILLLAAFDSQNTAVFITGAS
jgi:hypothetical protein